MIDPIQLIQDRHGKATKGPWEVAPRSDTDEIANVVADYEKVEGGARAIWIAELEADDGSGVEQMAADADFIAHAWEDIRTLLAEREALQAERDSLRGHVDKCGLCWTVIGAVERAQKAEDARDSLKAQLDALQEREKALTAALKVLRIDANRLCDRNLGGTYEADCRRAIAGADAALYPDLDLSTTAQPLPDETRKAEPPDGGYSARMAAAGIETERDERGGYKVRRLENPADTCSCHYAGCEHDNRKGGR